jgi:hypothetical protein
MGDKHFPVVRVTPKFAIVQINDVCQEKIARIVTDRIRVHGHKDIWSQVQYSVWRKVEEQTEVKS